MIGLGREKSKQHQITRKKIMAHKKSALDANASLFTESSFEKGLEEDIDALYQAEENCDKAEK